MPIEMEPDRFTLAFSSRTTVAFGFLSFALSAAIGPAVPPPTPRTSHSTCEQFLDDLIHAHVVFSCQMRDETRCPPKDRSHMPDTEAIGCQSSGNRTPG